ncbi:MAG: glycine cleavage T C-terminal barrel domain-containing protein [Gemmatimonadota bacterium]|nr:glycine cleavage T C-terminal barrel domain-containing protein [Gemmatimonadota bacterium]
MSDVQPAWLPAWNAARESAAVFDLSASLIELTGAERLEWLDTLVSNQVDDLGPGESARAFLLNPTKGRVLADFLVCEAGERAWLECAGDSAGVVIENLSKYYFGQEVEFEDRSGEWWIGSLVGPRAHEILTGVATDVPPGVEGLHETTTIAGAEVRVVRWSDTGLPGYHLWVPLAAAASTRTALEEAGAAPGHEEAWTVLQIEGGVAAYGRELTEETIPLEAPTEDAISHTKGCYPGQEVIARLWARGRPAKELRGLVFDDDDPPPPAGASLDAAEKEGVATITASALSPELGPVALAYVHRDYLEEGTRLAAADRSARVADLPLRDEPVGSS